MNSIRSTSKLGSWEQATTLYPIDTGDAYRNRITHVCTPDDLQLDSLQAFGDVKLILSEYRAGTEIESLSTMGGRGGKR